MTAAEWRGYISQLPLGKLPEVDQSEESERFCTLSVEWLDLCLWRGGVGKQVRCRQRCLLRVMWSGSSVQSDASASKTLSESLRLTNTNTGESSSRVDGRGASRPLQLASHKRVRSEIFEVRHLGTPGGGATVLTACWARLHQRAVVSEPNDSERMTYHYWQMWSGHVSGSCEATEGFIFPVSF